MPAEVKRVLPAAGPRPGAGGDVRWGRALGPRAAVLVSVVGTGEPAALVVHPVRHSDCPRGCLCCRAGRLGASGVGPLMSRGRARAGQTSSRDGRWGSDTGEGRVRCDSGRGGVAHTRRAVGPDGGGRLYFSSVDRRYRASPRRDSSSLCSRSSYRSAGTPSRPCSSPNRQPAMVPVAPLSPP